MKMACLDCILEIDKRLAEKKRAQAITLESSNGDSLQQAQYFEGEIAALEFAKKVMNRALNREV